MERLPLGMQLLLHRLRDEVHDLSKLEKPAHDLGHALDRPLHVDPLAEEQTIHPALGPKVEGVQRDHDQDRHHRRRDDRRLRRLPVREEDVHRRDGACIGQHHEPGGAGVHGACPERGPHVEQVVADQGVRHDDREEKRELPHRVEVRHGHLEERFRHRPENRRHVAENERRAENPGPLPNERVGSDHARARERQDQENERRPPVRGADRGDRQEQSHVGVHPRPLHEHRHGRGDHVGQPDDPRETAHDPASLREGQREVHECRRPEGPGREEQLGEPVRRVGVAERDVDDVGDEREGEEEPALGPPRPDQEHDGADRELEHARQETLGQESHEVPARVQPRRHVGLGQLTAPVDDVVKRGPGILALDHRLDVPAAPEHLAVHDADDVERLERTALGAPDRDEEVLQDPEAGEDPALAVVAVEGGDDPDGEGEPEDAPEERVPAHPRYCTPGRAGARSRARATSAEGRSNLASQELELPENVPMRHAREEQAADHVGRSELLDEAADLRPAPLGPADDEAVRPISSSWSTGVASSAPMSGCFQRPPPYSSR